MTTHDEPACPMCGAREWKELSYRYTWQPVTLALESDGTVDQVDYDSFDYGDDAFVCGIECGSCETVWPTYDALEAALAGEPHQQGEHHAPLGDPGKPASTRTLRGWRRIYQNERKRAAMQSAELIAKIRAAQEAARAAAGGA